MSEGSCREKDVQKHRLQTSLSSGATQAGESGRKGLRRQSSTDKSRMKGSGTVGEVSGTGSRHQASGIWLSELAWHRDRDPHLRAAP